MGGLSLDLMSASNSGRDTAPQACHVDGAYVLQIQ